MAFSDDVYLEFGRAADLAQAFECELGTALLIAEAGSKGLHYIQDPDAARRILDSIDARTLGSSLRVFQTRIGIPISAEELFQSALAIRNQLMHGFFLQQFPKTLRDGGNEQIVYELKNIQILLEHARAEAGEITEALMNQLRN